MKRAESGCLYAVTACNHTETLNSSCPRCRERKRTTRTPPEDLQTAKVNSIGQEEKGSQFVPQLLMFFSKKNFPDSVAILLLSLSQTPQKALRYCDGVVVVIRRVNDQSERLHEYPDHVLFTVSYS